MYTCTVSRYIAVIYDTIVNTAHNCNDKTSVRLAFTNGTPYFGFTGELWDAFVSYTKKMTIYQEHTVLRWYKTIKTRAINFDHEFAIMFCWIAIQGFLRFMRPRVRIMGAHVPEVSTNFNILYHPWIKKLHELLSLGSINVALILSIELVS